MSGLRELRGAILRLVGLGSRAADDDRVAEEMAFHLEQAESRYAREGLAPAEARRRARLAFGGVTRNREDAREALRTRVVEDAGRDVRHGWRTLRAHPAFGATAVLTVALAIAAAVTVFTIVDSIWLRPLPVPDAARLVRVDLYRDGTRAIPLGGAGATLLRARTSAFDAVVAHDSREVLFITGRGGSGERFGAFVSPGYFALLGVRPWLGRFFLPSEDSVPDRDAVAVIGYDLWRTQFGADAAAVGASMRVRGRPVTIIGVAPPGFVGISVGGAPDEVWLPTMMLGIMGETCIGRDGCGETSVIARLGRGVTRETAAAQVATLARGLSFAALGRDTVGRTVVAPVRGMDPSQRARYDDFTRLLAAIAALLIVIACANLAGLLVTRGLERAPEIALRYSLGASRARIIRQLLAEHLVIAAVGAAAGVALSVACVRALMGFFTTDSEGFPSFFYLSLDGRILAFAVLACGGAVLLFGLLPAITTSRVALARRAHGTRIAGRGRGRLTLTAAQVAVSLALLAGTGLLTRSFARLMNRQAFDPSHVALLRLRPQMLNYDGPRAERFLHDVVRRLRDVPGVDGVAFVRGLGFIWTTGPVSMPVGRTPGDTMLEANVRPVSPGFFSVLGIPLLEGREFTDEDAPGAPLVAVVSASAARRIFPGRAVVGQTIVLGGKAFRVVGVAADYTVRTGARPVPPIVAIPYWQNAFGPEVDARLAVRVRGDPAAMLPMLREAVHQVDAAVPVTETMPMTSQVSADYTAIRLGAAVLMSASGIALFLTGLGLFGVISWLVQGRTAEFGVRMAVGASPSQLVRLVLRQGAGAAALGIASGLAGALLGARLLAAWLVGIAPSDSVAFGAAASAVLLVALFATWLPARRAARIDPTTALRSQ